MSPQVEAVVARLRRTWIRWWTFSFWTSLVIAAALSLGLLALFVMIDAVFRLPQRGLGALFTAWAVVSAAAFGYLIVRLRKGKRTLAAAARRVESAFPELDSQLINIVQFANSTDPFRQAALAQAATAVADFPFDQAATRENRRRRFALCMQTPRDLLDSSLVLAAILGFGLLMNLIVPTWASSTKRLLHPFRFVPSTGSVKITLVSPGDGEVLIGATPRITARIEGAAKKALPAVLFSRPPGGPESALPMLPGENDQTYLATLPQVLAPLEYRLQIGDSQTRVYHLSVYENPTITDVEATYEFPAYLDRPRWTVKQNHADLEAPQYTQAELKIHPSTPIARGGLLVAGKTIDGEAIDQGRALLVRLRLDETTMFTVRLVTTGGREDPRPRLDRIKVQIDAPPTVQLVEPAGETHAAAGGKTRVVVRAGDDFGLGLLRIETRSSDPGAAEAGEAATLASWTKFAGPDVLYTQDLDLAPSRFKAGRTVWVRAVARDRRRIDLPGLKREPQESTTPWQPIQIEAAETKTKADLAQLDALHVALAKILQDQLRARATAAGLAKLAPESDETRKLAAAVRDSQAALQKATAAAVESIGTTDDPDRLLIKRVAGKLATGEMVQAIRRAEALEHIRVPAEFAKPAAELAATQDTIIVVLRRLVGEIRGETADLLAELKKRPGTELPSEVQSKLKDLKDKLQEFLKQQKKVVEATENLAKKPVEDFTEKDKQLLKELAATEDEWARFMAEAHSDLSKLPEQDFSNPSLLKELVEVQTELKMAKDALTKKTADIAVPLEQLGAEMAKEMTTNIEKWLPDTPDRERWSQEEPLTDDMKEAPMAELPKEMEDIVGKLMEDEEDLFNEMEDASSSWADSIDKGAGWDAMDGPISNNSARGVTGNRLPNTSEIAGRSGEGRQGKSSGEFVGDTAVGKGGRKTPSRLTADAYVKGQIKDLSKDPVGGATGGGKESGAGGEGLHGPLPNRPERDMGRLAAKQAQLRNKAEGVNLKFQVLKYHHADLKKTIEAMARVEGDLKAGRYRDALRRRAVLLEGLGQAKGGLAGESAVRQDQTPNLPTDVQKDILGGMREPSPRGWEELNRRYFDRLTATPAAGPEKSPRKPTTPTPAGKK